MINVNTKFSKEIKKYGAKEFEACYNCGNCTATCSLTEKDANFPRKFIRYGVLGQTKEILSSKELWLCYACGDCTENCPRQAAPGDYMSALRRYAIANYEPTGLTKLIFKNNIFSIIFTLVLAFVLSLYLIQQADLESARWIYQFIPYNILHNTGLVMFSGLGIMVAYGLINMIIKLSAGKKTTPNNSFFKSIKMVFTEIGTMKRYQNCEEDETSYWKNKNKYVQPWFVHWTIMWGFLGLTAATVLDFAFKDPYTQIWLPTRILGTITGILLIYGTSLALNYRIKKVTKAYSQTNLADWMFLILLWISGFSGLWLELAVTIDAANMMHQIVFLIHVIISMELVVLFTFSKFAHAVYRPLALFMYYFKKS